jgi:hypothetical protein
MSKHLIAHHAAAEDRSSLGPTEYAGTLEFCEELLYFFEGSTHYSSQSIGPEVLSV